MLPVAVTQSVSSDDAVTDTLCTSGFVNDDTVDQLSQTEKTAGPFVDRAYTE